jgi:hypothetical protein
MFPGRPLRNWLVRTAKNSYYIAYDQISALLASLNLEWIENILGKFS